MLTENDIIRILCDYLKENGYDICQSLNTKEKGFDIIAERNGTKLFVEAKGETSSMQNTKRYGKPFSKNQVCTHVAVAILASMKILSKSESHPKQVAIAFPDNENHRNLISAIEPTLKKTGIKVYLVGENNVSEFIS